MKDTSCLKLANKKEVDKWMLFLIRKGYSFKFIKGVVLGYEGKINIGCQCVETEEFFPFSYEEEIDNPELLKQ